MRAILLACLSSILLLGTSPAHAHRVNVFAWVEGGSVHVESEFSRGTPVKGGAVEVRNTDTGAVVATGATGEAGTFDFVLPESVAEDPADLEIVVDAGQGHRGSWTMRAQDYSHVSKAEAAGIAAPAKTVSADTETPTVEGTPDGAASAELEKRLVRAMDAKLDEKLTPLVNAVKRLEGEAGPSVAEIFGGIGYLVGLAGVYAYAQSRRRTQ